jgi:hypothetical protein
MNAINVIAPYKWHSMWVFDDARVGLLQEPFVAGADIMMECIAADIPDAASGFILLFASAPFPGHQFRFDFQRADDDGGNWYRSDRSEEYIIEGWLCPALFKYFSEAPKHIYVQAKKQTDR